MVLMTLMVMFVITRTIVLTNPLTGMPTMMLIIALSMHVVITSVIGIVMLTSYEVKYRCMMSRPE